MSVIIGEDKYTTEVECASNEDAKRALKKFMRESGVPSGKYVPVFLAAVEIDKIIVDDIWNL